MKIIINDCFGGFGVREDVLEKFGLSGAKEETIRFDPNLIALVESGEDINDDYSDLAVVEIPDNATDWFIDEYDGSEQIIYVVDGRLHWVG